MELIFDTLLNQELENNVIPKSVFSEASNRLYRMGYISVKAILDASVGSWADESNPWNKWNLEHGWGDNTYKGKWTTRFSSLCFKEFNLKLDEKVLSSLGELFGQYQKKEEHWFQITKKFHWEAGDFKERETSCWWTSYSYNRLGLSVDPNGYSVLFYKDKKQFEEFGGNRGVARCWMMNDKQKAYIFNAYGIQLSRIANILSLKFNTKNTKITLRSDGAYINGGNYNNEGGVGGNEGLGYVIGDNVENAKIKTLVAFSYNNISCVHCEYSTNARMGVEEDGMFVHDGDIYCRSCVEELFTRCATCSRLGTKMHDIYNPSRGEVQKVCNHCFTVNFNDERYDCVVHGKTNSRSDIKVWHTKRRYCGQCLREGLVVRCSSCDKYTDNYRKIPSEKRRLAVGFVCEKCAKVARRALNGKDNLYGHKTRLLSNA